MVADHDGVVVGFVHLILEADPRGGALLDNLHVTHMFFTLVRESVGRQEFYRVFRPHGHWAWPKDAARLYGARGGHAGRTDHAGGASLYMGGTPGDRG